MIYFVVRMISVIVGCCLFLLPLSAIADDLIIQKQVLEDKSGSLSVEQVAESGQFSPLDGLLVGGYSNSIWWLRLHVRPASDGQTILLRVRPTFLDDVRLYHQTADGKWLELQTGDRFSFYSAQRSLNSLGFEIQPEVQGGIYYLRLQTTSSSILHVQALHKRVAAMKDAQLILFHVLYFAFMTGVLLWAGLAWWRGHELIMGAFAVYQFTSLLHAMALTGYFSPFAGWFPLGWVDAISSVFVLLTAGSGFWFHAVVLRTYAPWRVLVFAMWVLVAIVPVLVIMYFLGHERLALKFNSMAVLVAGLLMYMMAISARREGVPSLRVLRTVYCLQAISIMASMLPFMGWVQAIEWSLQSSLIHGFISACLMVYMLEQRARILHAKAEEDRQRALFAEQGLQIKAQEMAAQGRSIDVLTHELKTPISIAMMSLGATGYQDHHIARARRAIGHLDAIVERTRLSVLADSHRLEAQMALCNVSVLVYECIEDSRAPQRIRAEVGYQLETLTDGQLLGLIVTNLFDNALKYSPSDSHVEVRLNVCAENDEPWLCLSVINAEGFAGSPDPALVFQKFYRSSGAQSRSGSGLGLFLCHHLAELIGARLIYRSRSRFVQFDLFVPYKVE